MLLDDRGLESLPFTLDSLRRAYAEGLTPARVVEEVFRRLAAAEDPGIFISVADAATLAEAADALGVFDPQGKPLWGVPVAVKDNIDVAGLPTTAACPGYAYRPERDAECVARLRAAGALIVGKANLDQFATGLVGVRTPYPVPRNACDPDLAPGGSSSGSAVAVARGLVVLALGTDTAGSGRVPAALNNIVGLKPTFGMISTRGVVPACRTLDCVSIFALTVDDAWSALSVMAGFDPADDFSRRLSAPVLTPRPPVMRVGAPRPKDRIFYGDALAEAAYSATLTKLKDLGAEIVEVDFSDLYATADLLYGPWVAERYAAIREVYENRPEILHPVTRLIIEGATRFSASDAFEGLYSLKKAARKIEAVWRAVDCLCTPSIPSLCTLLNDIARDPLGANSRLGVYTNFVNLLDMCALATPAGRRDDGRPASVTLIAPAGEDGRIAALARDLQAATNDVLGATSWRLAPIAPLSSAGASKDEIEIVVVGAHLSGLPLNYQLTEMGGQFSRSAATPPDYRLFLLPESVPAKPGLLRVSAGQGHTIEVEVWRLPAKNFGRFVANIPPPLGIGAVRLADGSSASGFLVEAEGVRDALDISGFGGWRNYIR